MFKPRQPSLINTGSVLFFTTITSLSPSTISSCNAAFIKLSTSITRAFSLPSTFFAPCWHSVSSSLLTHNSNHNFIHGRQHPTTTSQEQRAHYSTLQTLVNMNQSRQRADVIGTTVEHSIATESSVSPLHGILGSDRQRELQKRILSITNDIRQAGMVNERKKGEFDCLDFLDAKRKGLSSFHRNNNDKRVITVPGEVFQYLIRKYFTDNSLFYEYNFATAREVAEAFPSLIFVMNTNTPLQEMMGVAGWTTGNDGGSGVHRVGRSALIRKVLNYPENVYIDKKKLINNTTTITAHEANNNKNGRKKTAAFRGPTTSTFAAASGCDGSFEPHFHVTSYYTVTIAFDPTQDASQLVKEAVQREVKHLHDTLLEQFDEEHGVILEKDGEASGASGSLAAAMADEASGTGLPVIDLQWNELLPNTGEFVRLEDLLIVINRKRAFSEGVKDGSVDVSDLRGEKKSNAGEGGLEWVTPQELLRAAKVAALSSDRRGNEGDSGNIKLTLEVSITPKVIARKRGAHVFVDGDSVGKGMALFLLFEKLKIANLSSTIMVFRQASSPAHSDNDIVVSVSPTGAGTSSGSVYDLKMYQVIEQCIEQLRAASISVEMSSPHGELDEKAQEELDVTVGKKVHRISVIGAPAMPKLQDYVRKKVPEEGGKLTPTSLTSMAVLPEAEENTGGSSSAATLGQRERTGMEAAVATSSLVKDIIVLCGDSKRDLFLEMVKRFVSGNCYGEPKLNNVFLVTPQSMTCVE